MKRNERQATCDPDLVAYARQVKTLTFSETDGQHEELLKRWDTLKNISFYRRHKSCRVRLCLGGAPRVLGITEDLVTAARFADMARLFFWEYRLRDPRPPEDNDLNFSLVQAQEDCDTNGEAMTLLQNIRDYLLSCGVLRVVIAKGKESRRTVRGELIDVRADIEKSLLDLNTRVETSFEEIKKAFNHLLDKQQNDRKLLEQIKELLSPVQTENTDDEQS